MSLQAYRTLSAIAGTGSFSRVAEHLNMTLSAVSMQMKALERDLDVEIFVRSVRPPRLTPLGREIAERAGRITAAQDALVAVTRGEGPLRGAYRIGFYATASVRLLPGFLARTRDRAPEAQFTIETGLSETLQDRVGAGQLDAAVVTRSGSDNSKLTSSTIRSEELVYALPAGYGAEDVERCMADLAFILFMPYSGIGKLVSSHLASHGLVSRQTMILDSVEASMECVNAGIGLTILPRPDVERYRRKGVTVAETGSASFRREVSLVTAKGSVADGQREEFLALFA